jgi:uncharacterized YccA/Bax inhibitor family protein
MEKSNVFGRNENLALNSRTFQNIRGRKLNSAMTVQGAISKTGILLTIVAISAAGGWLAVRQANPLGEIWAFLSLLGALLVGMVTCLNMEIAHVTAPIYAFLEGSLLGFIAGVFEQDYPGLVINAVFLTFGTLLGVLIFYRLSNYHVTAQFRAGIISATLAILFVYSVEAVLQIAGFNGIQFLHQGRLVGIGFSLFIIAIAALNLILDFDLIERGARSLAPKYMEWYCAFGVMLTLIWVYLEILRWLVILYSSSDDN